MNAIQKVIFASALSLAGAGVTPGHPGSSVTVASGDRGATQNTVTISETATQRIIQSNGIPNHQTGRFPNRNNPNAIRPQSYEFRMPLDPEPAPAIREAQGHLFGVAVNGVVFDPGTAEFWRGDRRWNYEAKSGKIDLGLDRSNAHVQPSGAYHYHGIPNELLLDQNKSRQEMTMLGWAADGFPIYGPFGYNEADDSDSALRRMRSSYRVRSDSRDGGPGGRHDGSFVADYEYVEGSGDLDEANGRFGVTPEYPEGIYHYYLTDEYPYIPRMFRGEPDPSFRKGMGPGEPGRGRPGGSGFPPGPGDGPPPHGPRGKGKGGPPFPPPPGR